MINIFKSWAKRILGKSKYNSISGKIGLTGKTIKIYLKALSRVLSIRNVKWIALINDRPIIIFEDIRFAPYLYEGFEAISDHPEKPVVKINIRVLGQRHESLKRLLQLKRVNFVIKPIGNGRVIRLKADVFKQDGNLLENISLMPFPVHAIHAESKSINTENEFIFNEDRSLRIIFAGNAHEESYDNDVIKSGFSLLSRNEILERTKNKLGDLPGVDLIIDKSKLGSIVDFSQKRVAILDFSWSHHSGGDLHNRIEWKDWFTFLANADFFLACPGIRMPYSHNVVEAMYVGTIPILEFPHFFSPPLEDLIHCIAFGKGKRTLEEALELSLKMKDEQITTMRQNVLDYRVKHLSQEKYWQEVIDTKCVDNIHIPVTGLSEKNVLV